MADDVVIPFGPLGFAVVARTWARPLPGGGGGVESFRQIIDRVVSSLNPDLGCGFSLL